MSEFEQYLPSVLLALSAFSLGLLSPGPNVLAIIGTSMKIGRAQSIAMAIGIGCGSFLWISLAVVGFTSIISQYAFIMVAFKILGGSYLLWLGFKSLKSASTAKVVETSVITLANNSAYFFQGLAVQMTNPKAALANLAVASIGVHAHAPLWVGTSIVIGGTALSLLGHISYALAFSTKAMVEMYAKSRRVIEAAMGAFFCAVGLKLLTQRT